MNNVTTSPQIIFIKTPSFGQAGAYLERIDGCVLTASDTASISPCRRMIAIATCKKEELIATLLDEGFDRQDIH